MGKHAIIVIKNSNNEYLQYFDNRWDSYLFLNCKLSENFNNETIVDYISEKLKIDKEKIQCQYIGKKVHTKFSQSAQREKEYEHFFYEAIIDRIPSTMEEKNFLINDESYCWYSYDELQGDKRIQKVNSDIVSFIKEFNL